MKDFFGTWAGAAAVLLGIAVAGSYPVRAECNASESFIETAGSQGNESVSGRDGMDAAGDSTVTDDSPERREDGGAEAGTDAGISTDTDINADTETSTDTETGIDAGEQDGRDEANEENGEYETGDGGGASPHGLYHYEITEDFIVTVPAEVRLTEDVENNRIIGAVPVTVKYLRQMDKFSLQFDAGSFVMRDRQSGRTLPLEGSLENVAQEDGESISRLCLTGERLAGDWEGTVRLVISTRG